ncbi:MAG: hypothetical protein IPO78_13450 [Saprospiraceae bacterium]|nr:hypothetical protein [Saprospiraceae bacterium]
MWCWSCHRKYNIVHPSKPILLEKGSLMIDDNDIQEGFFLSKDVLVLARERMIHGHTALFYIDEY